MSNGNLGRIKTTSDVPSMDKYAVSNDKIIINDTDKTIIHSYHFEYENTGGDGSVVFERSGSKIITKNTKPVWNEFTEQMEPAPQSQMLYDNWDSYSLQSFIDVGITTFGGAIRASIANAINSDVNS